MLFNLTLALALVALIGDVLTTLRALDGPAHEANPVMRWLMGRIGRAGALIATHGGFWVFLFWVHQTLANVAVVVVFAAITVWNLHVIKKGKTHGNAG